MKKRIIYILILILVLTGCSAKAPNSTREPVKNDSSHETESTKELPETIKPDANITIEVESVKELLEAIKPDADITIKSGYYNLSEYIEEISVLTAFLLKSASLNVPPLFK